MKDTMSLLTDAETSALQPPGMEPDPDAARRYLAAVSSDRGNSWHAAGRTAWTGVPLITGQHATAVCGDLVTIVHEDQVYDRMAWPFGTDLCHQCAWYTAIATRSVRREIHQLTPEPGRAAQIAAHGADGYLAAKIACAVILGLDRIGARIELGTPEPDMAAVTLLAHIVPHVPSLAVGEGCSEGECECKPGACKTSAICWGCTPVSGDWAGDDYKGQALPACYVEPPCSILTTMAAYYKITQGTDLRVLLEMVSNA